jgi:hypothetical protein
VEPELDGKIPGVEAPAVTVTTVADDIPADGLPIVADRAPGEPEPRTEPGAKDDGSVEAPAVTVTMTGDDKPGDDWLSVLEGATGEPELVSDPEGNGVALEVVAPAVIVSTSDESVKVTTGGGPELPLEAEMEGEPMPFVGDTPTDGPEGAVVTGARPVE